MAGVGIMPLNTKGFKDTTTHDFMFKASRADADSLPVSMKSVVLVSHYIRVYICLVTHIPVVVINVYKRFSIFFIKTRF